MRRNDKDLPPDTKWSETGIKRNPGVVCLWTTLSYKTYRGPGGDALFSLGDPIKTEWWCEGRQATRQEILASMESGLPLLHKLAEDESPAAVDQLMKMYGVALQLVPQ
jgi:hypothetical protein